MKYSHDEWTKNRAGHFHLKSEGEVMQKKLKSVTISFFYILAFIIFFSPIFAIYKYNDGHTLVIIVGSQWMLSHRLWKQNIDIKKTLLLWILMSVILIIIVFLRDRVVFYLGKERWYHPVKYYIYIGIASTFWWAMVNILDSRRRKDRKQ